MKKSVFFIPATPFRVFLFFLFCLFCAGQLSAATWYVKPSGSDANAGNSWGAAFQSLTKALQSAAAGDQIWVAAGTYKPTSGTDRTISFSMKNGVSMLGGFPASGNPMLADRNWETNVTTLSGDIGTVGDNSDNSYHVVYSASLNNTAVLDGFVVTAGNANGPQPHDHGGGLKNASSSPTIQYCSFNGNSADTGGGVSNFINSSAIFDHCNFSYNTAPLGGGAIFNYTSAPKVKNCSFSANSSSSGGGAVYNHTSAAPTFINSIFFNNTGDANGSTIKTTFSSVTLTNCSFSGNSGSSSTIFNLVSTATITNCNIWGNSSGSIESNGTTTVSYSNVQGGYTGTGNSNANPLFVDAPTDLRLQACSPVINKGNNAAVPSGVTTDLDDNNRFFGTVDMGAYEYQNNPPSLMAACKNITVQLNGSGNASIAPSAVDNGSTGCNLSMYLSKTNFNCSNLGTNILTFVVSDNNFNSASCAATVTVQDNTNPTAVCKNATAYLDASGNVTIPASAVDNGSTDACGVATLTLSKSSFNCSNVGNNPVSLEVKDNNGNIAYCSCTITVLDSITPTAVCKNVTVQLNGIVTVPASEVDNGSTDACGIASISLSKTTFNCSNIGANTVTLTVTDNNGKTNNCTAIVTVQDNVAPTAICKNAIIQLDATGNAGIAASAVNNGSTDACGIASISLSKTTFNCSNIGANAVSLTVTDNNGNTATCSATVTVQDITKPAAVCKNATIYLDGTGNVTVPASVVDNGSTDACGIAALTLSKSNFNCSNLGNSLVSLEVKDNNGNKAYCSTTITILDSIAPIAGCKNVIAQLDATGNAGIVASAINNGSTDNCTISSYALSQTSFTCANLGENTVTLTATDASGNTASCTATVTVRDLLTPTMVCKPATIDLNASGQATLTVSAVNNGSSDNCAISSYALSQTSFTCANLGENTVTLTATDASGNTASCTATVTVRNLLTPTMVCKPATIDLDASGQATLTTAAVNNGSADNCTVSSLALSQTTFTCANLGENIVTLTATDQGGNTASCTSTVTVRDLIAPAMTCKPATIDLNAGGQSILTTSAVNNGSVDNCTISSLALSQTTFTCANLGENTVTLTGTDQSGNSATCTAVVTVRDLIAPTMTCKPATIDLNAGGQSILTTSAVNNGSVDNCTISSLALSQTTFTCANLGENTVTLTGTDQSGNSATCTAVVTVRDLIAPTMVCKPAIIDLNAGGQATLSTAAVNNGSADNCTISGFALSQTTFTCANLGENTVTLTATDQSGNTASCTTTVTIRDLIAPAMTCKPATIDLNASGQATLSTVAVNNGSADNCTVSSLALSQTTFTCANLGENTVTLTGTDQSGNSATCTAVVTVRDLIAPVMTCKPATIDLNAGGLATLSTAAVNNGSADNCTISGFALSQTTFTCANLGENTVTLTATDQGGNTASCTSTVTVRDLITPAMTCKPATIDLNAGGQSILTTSAVNNGSVDNCTISSFALSQTTFTCANLGENTVTLTATDQSGNTASCAAVVTVRDLIAPTMVCKPATIDLNASGQATLTTTAVNNGSADNCTISSLALSQTAFTCANLGENTVTLTGADPSGNSATCTTSVTVRDLIAPTMICKPATVDLNASGQATLSTAAVNNGSADNCTVSSLALSQTTFTCANLGENTVTLTATDQSGNTATCTAVVTVRDLIAPTMVCKPAIIDLNAGGQATLSTAAVNNGSADNCTISGFALSQTTFTCANLGENTVTLTATDQSGNTVSCTTTVTIRDLIAPTMTCKPATIDLNASGQATLTTVAVNNGSADNCTISSFTLSQTAFTCANLGENTVTLTATDQSGNTASCTATVTVRDLIAPTMICKPATIDLNASGQATLTTAAVNNGSADNCTISSFALSQTAFTCANLGENTVTLTATDQSSNTASCTATVTVRDLIAPTMICKPAIIDLNAGGQATLTTAAVNNGSADNCTVSSFALSQTAFTCANVGINTVTLTGTDQSGNTGQCTAIVMVKDMIAPVAKCKAVTANLGSNGTLSLNPSAINNGSTDNCSFAMTTVPSVFTCSNIGINTVTLIATDASGNSAACTAQVTIKDVSPPTALCKPATIYLNATGQATLTPAQVNNGSFDNCSIATFSINKSIFNCSELAGSPSSVTLTVKDGANNTSTCLAQITVKENIAPTAICVNTTVSLGANGNVTVYSADLASESFDNCSVWSYSPIAKVYTAANLGNNNLNITVKDWSGNTATCTSTVTVKSFNSANMQKDRDDTAAELESTEVLAHLFPNPTMGITNLALLLPDEQQVTIRAFDIAGRQVLQQTEQAAKGENLIALDFGTQQSGMYIIEVSTKEARLQKRLLVTNE